MIFQWEMNRFLVVLILFLSQIGRAQNVPEIPSPPRLVNDFFGVMEDFELANLEKKLLAYNDSTSTELVIVIESGSKGRETMEYATDLFSKWKIGKKGKDNGLLIYVGVEDRRMAIVTGYGMEGAIPDAATFTLRENILKPRFRNSDYYLGLDEASTIIFSLAAGEYNAEDLNKAMEGQNSDLGAKIVFLFFLFLIVLTVFRINRKGPKAIGRPLSPLEMLILGGGMSRSSGGWADFSNGSGSFGGGGGGFGGFGGGMTGGGGSAGGW
jgi:uncharacterized protein